MGKFDNTDLRDRIERKYLYLHRLEVLLLFLIIFIEVGRRVVGTEVYLALYAGFAVFYLKFPRIIEYFIRLSTNSYSVLILLSILSVIPYRGTEEITGIKWNDFVDNALRISSYLAVLLFLNTMIISYRISRYLDNQKKKEK